MGLEVQFAGVTLQGIESDDSWLVACNHLRRKYRVLWGFGRKQDAEIAVRVLSTTGINWDAPEPELRRQWDKYGGREALKKYVCERLQW